MTAYMSDPSPGTERPSSPFELSHAATDRPLVVIVPERRLLAIHGAGPRGASDFRLATTVLRTVGDILRGMLPRDLRADAPRQMLEVAWSVEPGLSLEEIIRSLEDPRRRWRQMIEVPRAATEAAAQEAIDQARRLGGREIPLVRLIHFSEGRAAQILHVGDADESPSIRKLYRFVAESGSRSTGDLHELVLADPDAVGRGRARSIFRVPIGSA